MSKRPNLREETRRVAIADVARSTGLFATQICPTIVTRSDRAINTNLLLCGLFAGRARTRHQAATGIDRCERRHHHRRRRCVHDDEDHEIVDDFFLDNDYRA